VDFYYGRVSGNSARAAFGLHEAGAHYTPHHVYTPSGENRSAPYMAINPVGKVPALTDGEVRLWESNAINWYAAEKHPESRLLPSSFPGRASVQRWLFFQTGHVSPACAHVFRATNTRMQKFWNLHGDVQSLEAGRKELARYLVVLEQALEGRDWPTSPSRRTSGSCRRAGTTSPRPRRSRRGSIACGRATPGAGRRS
jgi:glutathione S-transferase